MKSAQKSSPKEISTERLDQHSWDDGNSHPKRPSGWHISGLIGGLDEISGGLLDQICQVIYVVETLHDAIVNPQKPFGSVKFGSLLASNNDQLCELHGDNGSSFKFNLYSASSKLRFLQKEGDSLSLWSVYAVDRHG